MAKELRSCRTDRGLMETKTEFDRHYYQRLHNVSSESLQGYSKMSCLESLPTLILEMICNYLDGDSNLNLREASPHLNEAIEHIQCGENGKKYWLLECLTGVKPSLLHIGLNSFSPRIYGMRCQRVNQTSEPEDLTNYTWKHVFACCNKLVAKCAKRAITTERLTHIQDYIRYEQLIYVDCPIKVNPIIVFPKIGSTYFHVLSPNSHDDEPYLYAFERMGSLKLCTLFMEFRQDRIHDYRVLTLPMDTSLLEPSTLPALRTIVFFLTNDHIILASFSLIVGSAIKLTMYIQELDVTFVRLQVSKRFAIWGNLIAVWQSPNVILIYRVKLSATEIAAPEIFRTIILDGQLIKFWWNIFESPVEYTAILEFGTSDAYELQPTDLHQAKPCFSILSPTRTSCSVTYGNQNIELEFVGDVIETVPKLIGQTGFIPTIRNHGVLRGHRVEQSNVYFWSDRWLFKRIRDSIWQCQNLYPLVLENNEKIENIQIFTSDIIIVQTNENFFIIQLKQQSVATTHLYGDTGMTGGFFFNLIRKIPINSVKPPYLRVTYFHFGLELGEPCMFIVCDSINPVDRTPFSYELIKVNFIESDAELEESFLPWKLNSELLPR